MLKVFTVCCRIYLHPRGRKMLEKSAHCGTLFCTPHLLKVDEIGMACDMQGGDGNCIMDFGRYGR